ncbi:MAG TPA: four-carbon acid sugar kinase family protein [Chloroflexota bacterium]
MVAPVGVVADDLTGAADTSIVFRQRGWRALVVLDVERLPGVREAPLPAAPPSSSEAPLAVAVTTESRYLPPAEARARVARAARFLAAPGRWLYKKIDSTLRGSVGAEVSALLDLGHHAAALVAPSFPENGRTVREGVLRVGGVPLEATEIGRDPTVAGRGSRVADLLGEGGESTAELSLATISGGAEVIVPWLQDRLRRGVRVVVADAVEPDHLRALAEALVAMDRRVLPVGSAGLARALAVALAPLGQWNAPSPGRAVRADGPVVVVVGTRHPTSHRQVAELAARGATVLAVPRRGAGPRRWPKLVDDGPPVLVLVAEGAEGPGPGDPCVARGLAGALQRLAAEAPVAGLVLTGGETAMACCAALGVWGIELAEEVLPGVPLGYLLGGPLEGVPVVTKAGGFGPPTALSVAVRRVRSRTVEEQA